MPHHRARLIRTSTLLVASGALVVPALPACSSNGGGGQNVEAPTRAERTTRFNERVFEERASFKLVNDGDRALEDGRPEVAVEKYRAAINQHSGNFEARRKLAGLLLNDGQYERAARQLRIVRTEHPDDAHVLDMLAVALSAMGDAGAVESVLGERARRTNAAEDWLRHGRALRELGDLDGADRAFRRAAAADRGRNILYQLELAEFAERIGDDARALRRYRMALHLDLENEAARAGIRRLGEVPGPSFTLVPEEAR